MANAQAVARAFAPFAAIEEFQNVVQLHSKKNPVFLRRNLSYSATHQERTERDQKTTSILNIYLESLNAPAGYSNSITFVAAVCAVLPGDGALMVPIAAKVARVSLKPTSQPANGANGTAPTGSTKPLGVTLSIKVPFAQGILPKDLVVVLLHKRDRSISRIVRHITKAKHRGTDWNTAGREFTCTIKDNHAFQWYKSGTNVLFATVHPSEEMMMEVPPPAPPPGNKPFVPGLSPATLVNTSVDGASGSGTANTQTAFLKKGTIELQPGIIQTQQGFQNDDGDAVPSNFFIKNGAVGDATPMLRYVLTLEGVPLVLKKRKRDSFGGASPSHGGKMSGGGGASSTSSKNKSTKHLSNRVYPQPLTVNLCSFDGSLKIATKLQHGYTCPFESCGLRCRGSVAALQQHLVASHPYYESFVTKNEDQGAEVWIRCRKEWFGANGAFLPASGVARMINVRNSNEAAVGHPLAALLHKTASTLPFEFICREEQRRYRNSEGGSYPRDLQEERIEENAALMAENTGVAGAAEGSGSGASGAPAATAANNLAGGLFVWDTADLAPVELEIGDGRAELNTISEFEDSGAGAGAAAGAAANGGASGSGRGTNNNGTGRPPRPPPSRQRSGPLPRQQSLLPAKLPLTDARRLPKFYHRGRCIAMTEQELDIQAADSDDDSDTEQYMRYGSTALEEKPSLCKEEMEFMLTWNLYTLKNPILADSAVPAACIAFAKCYKERLCDAGGWFRRCFAAHVLNLWKFRLLTPAQMHAALVAAASTQSEAEEGGGGGGGGGGIEKKVEMSPAF